MFSGHGKKTELESSNRKISRKFPNIWKPTDIILNNFWVKEEGNQYFEQNENENSISSLCNNSKALLGNL